CGFSCNAELFQLSTVERMAHEYLTAVESLVSKPDLRISALPASWGRPDPGPNDDLVQELEQMTDEEAERLLEVELRSGLG
ncbi:MAG TPA: hypothetical protein VFZ87_14480, partial [Gemmatimonadales bacterium]